MHPSPVAALALRLSGACQTYQSPPQPPGPRRGGRLSALSAQPLSTGGCGRVCLGFWGRKESGSGLLTVSDPGLILPESACRWPQVFHTQGIRLCPMTLFNPVFNCLTPIVIKRSKTQARGGTDSSRRSWLCRSASAPSLQACEPVQDRCSGPCYRPRHAAAWRSRNRAPAGWVAWATNAITEGRARFRIGTQWFSRSGWWNRRAPALPCGRGMLAQFSLLQRFAVWWVAPPWPILSVAAVLLGEIRCRFIILARKDEPTPDYARKDEPTPDYAFLLPVRLVPGTGPRRPVPPRPRHPQQALRAETDRVPQAGGDRRAAGGAGPGDLDRPPGPSPAVGGDPNGAESVRTHWLAARRCRPRHGCAPPLRGQGPERTLHSAPSGSGRSPGGMVPRVSRRAGDAGIPEQSRRALEPGCRRATGRPPPAQRRTALPVAEAKARDTARAPPYRGHATASPRHRSLGHRAVAGARVGGDDPDLSPCRSAAEGRGPRQGDAVGHAAGAVPA